MFVISPFGKGGFRGIFLRLSLQIPPHPPLLKGGKLFVDKLLLLFSPSGLRFQGFDVSSADRLKP